MGHWIGDEPAALMRDFLREVGGCAVIDGGLATELEANGADLNDPLWSAKCLISSPHLIRKATIQGFMSRGFIAEEGETLLRKSVEIACEARELFYDEFSNGSDIHNERKKPTILVAASVGSYGAYLADGSEYSGDYGKEITLEN